MKKLILHNPSFEYIEVAFREWLDVLGYGQGTVYTMPNIIREFLYYLETHHVEHINALSHQHIRNYYAYIHARSNERRGGGLSNNYINKHLQAIAKLLEYLRHKGIQNLPTLNIALEKLSRKEIEVLTIEEVKNLFELCNRELSSEKECFLQARDKAMLVIYYSCGLRRNEGIHVDVDDINLDTRILHVKKGKNYKERFVPLNKTNCHYLQTWIYDYRNRQLQSDGGLGSHRLFINYRGEPTTGGVLYSRLKLLQQQSEMVELHQKVIGLHTLRHSIATHFLQAGMSLEKISRFLGHSSLESTQIYTHLV